MSFWENDWIGSKPVFYNTRTKKVSKNALDIIEKDDLIIDENGLIDFLDYGYCVFGATPFKHIRFVQAQESLYLENNQFLIKKNLILNENIFSSTVHSDDVFELFIQMNNNWANETSGKGILPLSGGYDSRLFTLMEPWKENCDAFTYAFYQNASNSKELNFAKWVANKQGIPWQEIRIENYLSHIDEWWNLFSITTHLHGMYHLEFYNKINTLGNYQFLLSGIIGDAWAGSLTFPQIKDYDDVIKLGLTHGMSANSKYLKKQKLSVNRLQFLENHKYALEDSKMRIIISMQLKMMLLRYLVELPKMFGWKVFSPFLDKNLALTMLSLSDTDRTDRRWQFEFFRKRGLAPDSILTVNERNNKNSYLSFLNKCPVEPIKSPFVNNIFVDHYVDDINKLVVQNGSWWNLYYELRNTRFHPITKRIVPIDNRRDFYNAYLTIKPLDKIFLKFGI